METYGAPLSSDSPMTERVKPPADVVAALRNSGFPFQTAVQHAVQAAPGWRVHRVEYGWETPTGDTSFLDLVATNRVIYVTIECKRMRKGALTFLRPLGNETTGLVEDFRCLRATNMQDSVRGIEIICEDWALHPVSNMSQFCVVSTSESGKDQRLLERDAGLLTLATEAFALGLKEPTRELPLASLVIPVIVTNAPIYTVRYKPGEISLRLGELTSHLDDVTKPPCVRFDKAFPSCSTNDLGDRTVFVANAESFVEFLTLLGPAPIQPDRNIGVFLQPRDSRRRPA